MASNKLWNTGVDDTGAQLVPYSVDPHWRLIQGPGITNPQNVYVLEDQRRGTYFTPLKSMWVGADPSGVADPSGPYVFQTEFYLELDPSQYWIEIKGEWGADNFGQFTTDGSPLPPGSGSGAISLPAGDILANYNQSHAFSISQAHLGSLSHLRLKVGWHTLEAWVYNYGPEFFQYPNGSLDVNPAGFNVSALHIVPHPVQHFPTARPP